MDKYQTLKTIKLLQPLEESQLQKLHTQLKYARPKKGELIIQKGTPSDSLLFLFEGELDIVDISEDGKLFWLAAITPGMHSGELGIITGQPRTANVIANTDSHIGFLKKEDALNLILNYAAVTWQIMQRMANIIERNNTILAIMKLSSAQERIEAYLSQRIKRYANNTLVIENLPSQQTLASITNTSRETVSRVISKLIKQGILEKDLKRLIVRKPEQLKDLTN